MQLGALKEAVAHAADCSVILKHAKGVSMLPLIFPGSVVALASVSQGSPVQVGDVVWYRSEGRDILHRVVGMKDHSLEIFGDSQLKGERIDRAQVLGVALGWWWRGVYYPVNSRRYRRMVSLWLILPPLRVPMWWIAKALEKAYSCLSLGR